MSAESSFDDLILRVRAGDEQAARELVERYERILRTMIRVRLTDPNLRRVLDSMDILQSVLANFFVRAAAGQFDLKTPGQLVKLLEVMARNKIINHSKRLNASRRDERRRQEGAQADECAAPGASPIKIAANKELLEEALKRFSPQERQLVEERVNGRSWPEIAELFGGQPDALRMSHRRALDRIARELQFDE
jgi:RNA polymerase sigma factor (sigma-70 family)